MAGELVSETVTNKVTHCESLLEALENCDVTKQGVNIAATVQRTYKEPNSDKKFIVFLANYISYKCSIKFFKSSSTYQIDRVIIIINKN